MIELSFCCDFEALALDKGCAVQPGAIQKHLEGDFSLLTCDVDLQGAFVDFFSAFALWWKNESDLNAVNITV